MASKREKPTTNVKLHDVIDNFEEAAQAPCVGLAVVLANGAVQVWRHGGIKDIKQIDWLAERLAEASIMVYRVSAEGET